MENQVSPQVDITLKVMAVTKAYNKVITLADLATSEVPNFGSDLLAVHRAHSEMTYALSVLVSAIGDQMVAKGLQVSK